MRFLRFISDSKIKDSIGFANKQKTKILYILLFIVMAGILYLVLFAKNNSRQTEVKYYQTTPTEIPTVLTNTPAISVSNGVPLESYKADQKKFISSKLGISFNYIAYYSNTKQKYNVKEVNNKVYLYPEGSDYTAGQSVEVFQKNKNESLKDVISRMFLLNKDINRCEIKISVPENLPMKYMKAEITLSSKMDVQKLNPDEYVNETKACSEYATPTYISYFLEDKNHPDKFVYFDIGLEALMGSETETWQDTIKFID
jgi:hypothetical protein